MNLFAQAKEEGKTGPVQLAEYMKKYGEKLHPTVYAKYWHAADSNDGEGFAAGRIRTVKNKIS